jgi:uncharacterized protein YlaN (UPF0358 family)
MTAHKSFRDYINLVESAQQPVAEGMNDNAMAGLQRTIDFAKQHGYKISRSPNGKKMKFVNTALRHEIRAIVDNDGDSINVNYIDDLTGESGNDDASYFDQVFKDAYNQALSDQNQQTGFNDPGVDAEKYLEKKR